MVEQDQDQIDVKVPSRDMLQRKDLEGIAGGDLIAEAVLDEEGI
jgi:hypothetical protein